MFVDTNVLVRSRMDGAPDHDLARSILDREMEGDVRLRISRQIVREFLAVVTRSQEWSSPLSMSDALDNVQWMMDKFHILEDGPRVTNTLVSLCRQFLVGGRQIHDANIVATMLAHGERRLLTFNPRDFRRYGDVIELVPTDPV